MSARRSLVIALLLASLAMLLLAGCGGDDDEASTTGAATTTASTGTSASAGNPETRRYCALSKAFEVAGQEAFLESGAGTEDQAAFARAQRDFLRTQEAELAQIVRVAPPEIRAQVRTVVASFRSIAGLGPKVGEEEVLTAAQAIQQFEARNCPG